MSKKSSMVLWILFLCLPGLWALGSGESYKDAAPLVLDILHVNDTHSKFEPTQIKLTLDLGNGLGKKAVYVEMGGYAQLTTAVADLRKSPDPLVTVHAGDFVQGTLYYTKYLGEADVAFWNSLGLDAATLGNHEFDKGPGVLKEKILDQATFPILTTNLDFSREPALAGAKTLPTLIKIIGGTRVAFLGLTTPDTPFIASPGPQVRFLEAAVSAQNAINSLSAQGVNKIILLSHLGYQQDLALAATLTGADVIVGGHSHTLMGDFSSLGLGSGPAYPTAVTGKDGKPVLVVQSWEWAKLLGHLEVTFDAQGIVQALPSSPKALVNPSWMRIYDLPGAGGALKRVEFRTDSTGAVTALEYDGKAYALTPDPETAKTYLDAHTKALGVLKASPLVTLAAPDPKTQALVEKYGAGVKELRTQIVAEVAVDLKRGLNTGPGPLIADSMKALTGADIAVMNPGGVRTDLAQGPLSVAAIYELQPFGNTLVTLKLPGDKVLSVLEDMTAFSLEKGVEGNPLICVSGLRFTVDPRKEKGQRISALQVETEAGLVPLDPAKEYSLVVNNFMAGGGDKNDTLKAATDKYDTGFVDAEAFLTYFSGKVLTEAPQRITLIR